MNKRGAPGVPKSLEHRINRSKVGNPKAWELEDKIYKYWLRDNNHAIYPIEKELSIRVPKVMWESFPARYEKQQWGLISSLVDY